MEMRADHSDLISLGRGGAMETACDETASVCANSL